MQCLFPWTGETILHWRYKTKTARYWRDRHHIRPKCLYLLATTANHPTKLEYSSTLFSEPENSDILYFLPRRYSILTVSCTWRHHFFGDFNYQLWCLGLKLQYLPAARFWQNWVSRNLKNYYVTLLNRMQNILNYLPKSTYLVLKICHWMFSYTSTMKVKI